MGWVMALGACVPIERTVRTERGPLIRSFTRPSVSLGGLKGEITIAWPQLNLRVTEYDLCRETVIDEYAEERVTEKSSRAAGPALSTGIAATLLSAGLFGISYLLSSAPDTTLIDATGRFGPSPRTIMQGWSLVALAVGVPALGVGLVSWFRTGEEVEQMRVEQEASQKEAECNARAVQGSATLRGPKGTVGAIVLSDGVGAVQASGLLGTASELRLGDRDIVLDETGIRTLDGFSACVALEREANRSPSSLDEGALVARAERLAACRHIRGAEIEPMLEETNAELKRRKDSGSPGAFAPGPQVASFEEAVAAYAPRLFLKAGSADLEKLNAPDLLNGQAAYLQGIVSYGIAENIGVLQLGAREIFVFIPPRRSWGGDFGNGARVEAVAVMAGWQTVGERTLPLARLVWLRNAL
jgi:hypothetical protein